METEQHPATVSLLSSHSLGHFFSGSSCTAPRPRKLQALSLLLILPSSSLGRSTPENLHHVLPCNTTGNYRPLSHVPAHRPVPFFASQKHKEAGKSARYVTVLCGALFLQFSYHPAFKPLLDHLFPLSTCDKKCPLFLLLF